MRTVWLTILCLALVSVLAAGKALKTPDGPTVAAMSADESTISIDDARDTLNKADRLDVIYMRQEVPPPAILPSIEPAAPVVTLPDLPTSTKIVSRHWRDPNASSSSLKDSRRAENKKKNKSIDHGRNHAADRSKKSEPLKACTRPGAFGDLLIAMNLSPACAS